MKITKFEHSCLLVETPGHVALFDPGFMSEEALIVDNLSALDDIFITHEHGDHISIPLVKRLVSKFPAVRITATPAVVEQLQVEGIEAHAEAPEGVVFFDSPHEAIKPFFDAPPPQEIGIHYLDTLSHPGDSHSFHETKGILALPVQAPWGSTVRAVEVALELKPKHVLPIHDWHWRDEARQQMYERMEELFKEKGITFHKLETGQPVEIEV